MRNMTITIVELDGGSSTHVQLYDNDDRRMVIDAKFYGTSHRHYALTVIREIFAREVGE